MFINNGICNEHISDYRQTGQSYQITNKQSQFKEYPKFQIDKVASSTKRFCTCVQSGEKSQSGCGKRHVMQELSITVENVQLRISSEQWLRRVNQRLS